jgi:PKD repeat protein
LTVRPLVALAAFFTLLVGAFSCSKGIGNNRKTTAPLSGSTINLPTGLDVGTALTDPAAEPVIAGFVLPAIGASPARDVVLVAFSTAAAANDADGSGTPLSRDATNDANGAADVFVALLCAQDIETRAFSQSLAGKFRHPRCATCHSMSAPDTTAFVSSASFYGQPHAGPPPGDGFPFRQPEVCAPCHVNSSTFPVPGWQAPESAIFDIRPKTVAQIAQMAMNVPADETEHFVTDKRVLWALDSGILPQVGGRNGIADDDQDGIAEPEDIDGIPRTVPGGSVNFLHEIEDWRASGMVISTADAVKDITLVSRQAGTNNAANGASTSPRIVWVPNPSFDPASAAATNPVGTLYVAFQSTASNLVAGFVDNNGMLATDVFRAAVEVRAEQDVNGGVSIGGLNLVTLNSTVLCSATSGTTIAGNGASSHPAIAGPNAEFVAFQSLATNLVGGFANNNGTGADVFVRKVGPNTTQLVSHANGAATSGGNGASEAPSISANGAFLAVAFESDANDLLPFADGNGVRDVFYADVSGAGPYVRARASVTDMGAEGTGGDCRQAAVWTSDAGRVLCAFESDMTDLDPSKVAATNVFLFDSNTGSTTLLNQRISPTGSAIGTGSARAPVIAPNGSIVAFESDANEIDVLRDDTNKDTDVFLVETAQVANGVVLPFRISLTTAQAAGANGPSTKPSVGTFTNGDNFRTGFACYPTAATNLGTSDTTNIIVAFLDETSGVLANFDVTPPRGAAPLSVQFTDKSTGNPTSWEWDLDGDGNVDSTEQHPAFEYEMPGLYTVQLTARNDNGEGTLTKTDFVLAVGPITPDFTASVASGVAPLSVTFTDTSTQSPTAWQWDFQDDSTVDSTQQNPTFVYNTPGTYTVRLIATNEVGDATETKTGLITVFAPVVAGFTRTPSSGVAPFNVTFTNTSTGATSYQWDFNEDGIVDSTATNPVFNYTVGGTYDVKLTATGPGGANMFTFTDCVTVFSAVTANFTMTVGGSPITSAYEATNITFTSTSTGSITSWSWDFDSIANPGVTTATGTPVVRNFASTTASTRTFSVKLTVSGPGGSSNITRTLTIVSDTETLMVNPSADTTIYENPAGNSNGAGVDFVVGKPAGTVSTDPVENFSRRALLRFDVSSIPSGSTINSATMQITSDTPVATTGTQTIRIHRVTEAWTEGTAGGAAGIGSATAGGGATWINRSFSTAWSSAGGTVAAFTSSFTSVSTPTTHTSGSLASDVQLWVNGTANNGWQLRNSNEANSSTAKKFDSRTGTTPPVLTVVFKRPLP